jgi:hypothetical protein
VGRHVEELGRHARRWRWVEKGSEAKGRVDGHVTARRLELWDERGRGCDGEFFKAILQMEIADGDGGEEWLG